MTPLPYPIEKWTHPDQRARLLELLKEKSYIEGEVKLASGKISNFYIDCRQTSLNAEGAYLIGQIFYRWIEHMGKNPDAVGGMTMGADPLVTATSVTSYLESNPIGGFLIRKEPKGHGTGKQLEGNGSLKEGAHVILLEDVVTTGGSTIRAIEACRKEGLVVTDVFCLVDRMEGGAENIAARDVLLTPLFTRKDFLKIGE